MPRTANITHLYAASIFVFYCCGHVPLAHPSVRAHPTLRPPYLYIIITRGISAARDARTHNMCAFAYIILYSKTIIMYAILITRWWRTRSRYSCGEGTYVGAYRNLICGASACPTDDYDNINFVVITESAYIVVRLYNSAKHGIHVNDN